MGAGGDRFAARDLRFTGVRLYFELAEHAVTNDFQVQLAHSRDDGLAGVLVRVDAESRIFFGEPLQGSRHFFLVQLRLRLNRPGDNRIGKRRRLEKTWVVFIAERVSSCDVFDSNNRGDIARVTRLDVFAFVRLDLN